MKTMEELRSALAQARKELAQAREDQAKSDRDLAQARADLIESQGRFTREARERKLAENALAEALKGARCLHWHATVYDAGTPTLGSEYHWDLTVSNEEVAKLWIPIAIRPGQAFARAWGASVADVDRHHIDLRMRDALDTRKTGYEQEFRIYTADGDIMWFREEVTIEVTGPQSWYLVGTCTDITGEKRREEHTEISEANSLLEALAFHDDLTGLPNRRAFHERFAEEFERAKQYHTPLSLIILDVDRFKEYNDAFGHPAGDVVLVRVAQLLQQSARDVDFVARFGGEEITIIAPCNQEKSLIVAERLRAALEAAPWPHRPVTASFGVTTFKSAIIHPVPETLISEADQALYRSKAGGRNRVTHAQAEDAPLEQNLDSYILNAGGSAVEGTSFMKDSFYAGGASRSWDKAPDTSRALAPAPVEVYQTERFGDFSYRFADFKLGGLYLVRLHFAEMEWNEPGARLFDVMINRNIELVHFDIVAEAGAGQWAVVKEIPFAVNAGGELILQFISITDFAVLSGLEVVPVQYTDSISINCGDSAIGLFIADRFCVDGDSEIHRAAPTKTSEIYHDGDHYFPEAIYRCNRFGTFTYKIPDLPPGTRCLVALHFCEIYWKRAGNRIFNVLINGVIVLQDFDILEKTLVPFRPIVKRYPATINENGEVIIEFISVLNLALVAAIEVFW